MKKLFRNRGSILILFFSLLLISGSCKKSEEPVNPFPDELPVVGSINNPDILGCFNLGVEARTAVIPSSFDDAGTVRDATTVRVVIDPTVVVANVSKYVYGNNVNQYNGNFANINNLTNNVKLLDPHILRYPGGLHSNEYFWNARGRAELPSDLPDKLTDGSKNLYSPYWVAGLQCDSWNFFLDDFYEFLRNTGCEALFTVNYSYARYGTGNTPVQTAAHLAADWVRYDAKKTAELGIPPTKFWEVGNENCASWASGYNIDLSLNKDGQPETITPLLYGRHFKVFADSMKKAAAESGHTIYIGSQNDAGVLAGAGNSPDWMVDHTYFTPYAQNSNASTILHSVNNEAASYPAKTAGETAKYKTDLKPTTLTEWNIFAEGSGQTSSYINGIHAVEVLGELIKNQYGMGNRWDIVNGWGNNGDDMGMFSTGSDPDGMTSKGNPRAMFYYMYFFQKFFGDKMVNFAMDGAVNEIIVYPSSFSSGELGVIIVNTGVTAQTVQLFFSNFAPGKRFYYYSLTGGNERKGEAPPASQMSWQVFVNGIGPKTKLGGPTGSLTSIKPRSSAFTNTFKIASPALSVQYVLIEH